MQVKLYLTSWKWNRWIAYLHSRISRLHSQLSVSALKNNFKLHLKLRGDNESPAKVLTA